MKRNTFLPLIGTATLLCASSALAHPGHGTSTSGFITGILHPFTGWDHILAMVAVGLCAARVGGRAIWLLPATFVAFMAGGGLLGMRGAHVPMVEQGIAASILVFGAVLAFGAKFPTSAITALVGFFALFHGFAHGSEMQPGLSRLTYAAGFIVATVLLHAAGIGAGLTTKRAAGASTFARLAGGAIASCGMVLLAA